ncbi:MAG: EFR1 family ferrodoxin [Treponema sp.]
MRAVLYVFSGTGNTRLVAELYKKYLTDYETVIYDIQRKKDGSFKTAPNPSDFDLVGFGYPIHGFNAPEVMVDFCKSLPDVNEGAQGRRHTKKRAFLFKSSGEGHFLNNYSSGLMIKILEKKGFEFLTERHYVMPYNMIFRHSPEMVKSEFIYADALVRLSARGLQSGRKENVHFNPLKAWFVPIIRIEWIYARLQGPFMKVDMKKCIECMKCVNNCPLENIDFDGARFKFGTECALCVRCSFHCPTCAISIGLLNGWRVNGSYRIKQTAADKSVRFPYFGEDLKGLHRLLYYNYFRRADKELAAAGIRLMDNWELGMFNA